MAKKNNTTASETVTVTLSTKSVEYLDQLAEEGVYGRNRAEVAGRFIDRALQEFIDSPRLSSRISKGIHKISK